MDSVPRSCLLFLAALIVSQHPASADVTSAILNNYSEFGSAPPTKQPPLKKTPLIEAIERQNLEKVRDLLERGADVNEKDGQGFAPLVVAVSPGMWGDFRHYRTQPAGHPGHYVSGQDISFSIVRLLLQHGAPIEEIAPRGDKFPALLQAIRGGNLPIVQLLVTYGAPLQASRSSHGQPLLTAVTAGYPHLVRYLLRQGVDPEAKGERTKSGVPDNRPYQDTPLHLASKSGNLEIACLLVEAGANIEAKRLAGNGLISESDRGGETPLMLAASTDNNPVLDYLIQRGVDLSAQSNLGETALHYAANGEAVHNVEKLLKAGVTVDTPSQWNKETPLHIALKSNYIHSYETWETKHLHQKRCEEIVGLLAAAGANPNVQDYRGQTPLGRAAELGLLTSVRFLMAHGGDPYAGANALLLLAANGNLDLAKKRFWSSDGDLLPEKYAQVVAAAHSPDAAVAQLLLPQKDSSTVKHELSMPDDGFALLEAAAQGNVTFVRQLVNSGIPINFDAVLYLAHTSKRREAPPNNPFSPPATTPNRGRTALHVAASKGQLEVVRYLISQQADLNTRNAAGMTALMSTAASGSSDFVNHLRERFQEASGMYAPQPPSFSGGVKRRVTARELLAWRSWAGERDSEIFRLLLQAGCQWDARSTAKLSALHYAAMNSVPAAFNTLLRSAPWSTDHLEWQDKNGHTALMLVILYGRRARTAPELAKTEAAGKQDFFIGPPTRLTVSHRQALIQETRLFRDQGEADDLEIIASLMKAGASPQTTRADGKSAVDLAREAGFEAAVRLMTQ